jgi:hypothetical protein
MTSSPSHNLKGRQSAKPRRGTHRPPNSGAANRHRDRSFQRPSIKATSDDSGIRVSPAHSLNTTPKLGKPPYYKHWAIIQIGISAVLWVALIASIQLLVTSI